MTLMHHRGHAQRCIPSWSTDQTYRRDLFEILVVTNGEDPLLDASIQQLLTDSDRLVQHPTTNEMELYDIGARQARGSWLLFTESHCIAAPDCLDRLMAHLEPDEVDGACLRSMTDRDASRVERLEARMYQEEYRTWSSDGDWRRVTKRGTALRRSTYLAVDGFEYAYGWFAETALAARLDDGGYRIGVAEDAVVVHHDSTELDELLEYVWDYRAAEMAYRQTQPEAYCRRYFGPPPVTRWPLKKARAALRYWLARAWLAACRFAPEGLRYRAFMGVWNRMSDYARWTHSSS